MTTEADGNRRETCCRSSRTSLGTVRRVSAAPLIFQHGCPRLAVLARVRDAINQSAHEKRNCASGIPKGFA